MEWHEGGGGRAEWHERGGQSGVACGGGGAERSDMRGGGQSGVGEEAEGRSDGMRREGKGG